MEKSIKEILGNPAAAFSRLAENSLRWNWAHYFKQHHKERLLARFGLWIELDAFPVDPEDLSFEELELFSRNTHDNWNCRTAYFGNWAGQEPYGYSCFDDALDAGFEALLEEWDAEYVLQIFLDPARCPLTECREAAEIMRMERNRQ